MFLINSSNKLLVPTVQHLIIWTVYSYNTLCFSYFVVSPGWCDVQTHSQRTLRGAGGSREGGWGRLIATLVTLMTINTLSICQETMRKGGLRWWWATLKTLIQHLSTSFEVRHGVDRGGRAGPAVKKGRSGRLWPPPIHMLPSCLKTKSNRPSPSHCPG